MINIKKIAIINLHESDKVPLWEFVWEEKIREDKIKYIEEYVELFKKWHKKKYIKLYIAEWNKEIYEHANVEELDDLENWSPESKSQRYVSVSLSELGKEKLNEI